GTPAGGTRAGSALFCHDIGRCTLAGRFTSGACAHHPNYFQGLRRKTVGQETLRESEPMQRADSCDAFSYLLIVCAWCQQYIRWHRVQPPEPLTTSHGICTHCYAQMLREIEH